MADGGQVLREMIGTPRIWLYTMRDNLLMYYDREDIAKYITQFEYTYDEMNDDVCNITFEFETLRGFSLDYLGLDTILKVEWGYILESGRILKSPRRTIVIRDSNSTYSDSGLKFVIRATDLASYNKSVVRKTKNVWTDPLAQDKIDSLNRIKELENQTLMDTVYGDPRGFNKVINMEQNGVVTIVDKVSARYALNGSNFDTDLINQTLFTEDQINEAAEQGGAANRPQSSRRVNRAPAHGVLQESGLGPVQMATTINKINTGTLGHNYKMLYEAMSMASLGYRKAIENLTKPAVDSMDDKIYMKYRNADQTPFRVFTFGGTTGELLSFKTDQKFARVQVNKAKNTSVNPLDKTVETQEVEIIDNEDKITIPLNKGNTPLTERDKILQQAAEFVQELDGHLPPIGSRETYEEYLEREQRITDEEYKGAGVTYKNTKTFTKKYQEDLQNTLYAPTKDKLIEQLGSQATSESYGTVQAIIDHYNWLGKNHGVGVTFDEWINSQTDEALLEKYGINRAAAARSYMGTWTGPGSDMLNSLPKYGAQRDLTYAILKNELTSELDAQIHNINANNKLAAVIIEKALRRYKANAIVIGDPSLIKGKNYKFNNLGPKDSGKWYCIKASHKINNSKGYTTEFELWRRPKDVTVAMKQNAYNSKFDTETETITIEDKGELDVVDLHFDNSGTPEEDNYFDDVNDHENAIAERLDILNNFDSTIDS